MAKKSDMDKYRFSCTAESLQVSVMVLLAQKSVSEGLSLDQLKADDLTKRKQEASESRNIHVSLALTVMQRRLVSSIFAIKNTLERRWKALQSIIKETNRNPNLWSQRHKLEGYIY